MGWRRKSGLEFLVGNMSAKDKYRLEVVRAAVPTSVVDVSPDPREMEHFGSKEIVPSGLSSAEWEALEKELGPEITQRAFFSARIEDARFLSEAQEKLNNAIGLAREQLANGNEAYVTRGSFIADMQRIANEQGLVPHDGKYGSITDPASFGRLAMIWDIQEQSAAGYTRFKSQTTGGAMKVRPAWELVRIAPVQIPRDWQAGWEEADGETYPGKGLDGGPRLIALKTDSIWSEISRFGVPWPPFDFGSHVGVRGVPYDECVALGVIDPEEFDADEEADGMQDWDFNDDLEFNLADMAQWAIDALKGLFGNKAEVSDDLLKVMARELALNRIIRASKSSRVKRPTTLPLPETRSGS